MEVQTILLASHKESESPCKVEYTGSKFRSYWIKSRVLKSEKSVFSCRLFCNISSMQHIKLHMFKTTIAFNQLFNLTSTKGLYNLGAHKRNTQ